MRTDRIPADGWRVASEPLFQGSLLMAPAVLAAFAERAGGDVMLGVPDRGVVLALPAALPSAERFERRVLREWREAMNPCSRELLITDGPIAARVSRRIAGVRPGGPSLARGVGASVPPSSRRASWRATKAPAAPIATAAANPTSVRTAVRVAWPRVGDPGSAGPSPNQRVIAVWSATTPSPARTRLRSMRTAAGRGPRQRRRSSRPGAARSAPLLAIARTTATARSDVGIGWHERIAFCR